MYSVLCVHILEHPNKSLATFVSGTTNEIYFLVWTQVSWSLKRKWKGLAHKWSYQRTISALREMGIRSGQSYHRNLSAFLCCSQRCLVQNLTSVSLLAFYKQRWSLLISDHVLKSIFPKEDLFFNSSNPLIDWVWKHHRASYWFLVRGFLCIICCRCLK